MTITKQDLLSARLHQAGLVMVLIEMLGMAVWAAATQSLNPWIFLAIIATALATGCCMGDQCKRNVLNRWEELGESLSSFPVTENEKLVAAIWAKQALRELARENTMKFAEVAKLRKKLEEAYGRLDHQEADRLESALDKADLAAASASKRYKSAWEFLTHFIAPGMIKHYSSAEEYQEWVAREPPVYSMR